MGTLSFMLPPGLDAALAQELERACVAGGPDNFPLPTTVQLEPDALILRRSVEESGCLVLPWDIAGAGRLMASTATVIERQQPYHLQVELARGKVNQLRCQVADWQEKLGFQMPEPLAQEVRQACLAFTKAVTQPPSVQAGKKAQAALELGYRSAEQLAGEYVEQMFQARHQRQPRLDTSLGCCLGTAPVQGERAALLSRAFNSVRLPLAWNEVEPAEGSYRWESYDALLAWAGSQGLAVTAGPLIDFSPSRLPDWLWLWERDPSSLAGFMCDYVETAVKRYGGTVQSWQLTAASNSATVLDLGEDELLWLTARLAEVARQVNPKLELIVGISQPWGEYMAAEDRTHSPLIFADTLVRAGLNVAALDLELVLGVTGRGSYCRDLMETSRLLDLYTTLGVPLRVTLGYPSSREPDAKAYAELEAAAGQWHGEMGPEAQAHWASAFTALALAKQAVRAVHWVHLSDAEPHHFPRCGLFDADDRPKPALQRLRELRDRHLR